MKTALHASALGTSSSLLLLLGPSSVAIGADNLTLANLFEEAGSPKRVDQSRDQGGFGGEVVEIHHKRGISHAAIRARLALEISDNLLVASYSSSSATCELVEVALPIRLDSVPVFPRRVSAGSTVGLEPGPGRVSPGKTTYWLVQTTFWASLFHSTQGL